PLGTYELTVTSSTLGATTRSVVIESDINVVVAFSQTVSGLKVIAQTGASSRAAFNVTPASITQINPLQQAFSGQTSWRNILEQIPGVTVNTSRTWSAVPAGPSIPYTISIDGAPPYETATMLDDMPLYGGGGTTPYSTGSGGAGAGFPIGAYAMNGF